MEKNLTVIGTSFAGLAAAARLRKLAPKAEITMIGPKPEFVFLPSLIWIPSGLRKGEQIRLNLDNFFSRQNIRYHQGKAVGLRDGGRVVVTDTGEVANDGLIIASGGRFLKKLPGIEHAITPCEGITAAERIRDRIREMDGGTIALGFATNPNEPAALRGGPMFEFLFGIDRQLRREGRRDKFKLVFFSPAPKPGIRLGWHVVERILKQLSKLGIEHHLGHKLKGFEERKVITEGGEIEADLILFMPGLTGLPWYADAGLPLSPGGMIAADTKCQVEGFENVYVAGDAGSYPGPDWMPKQAHMSELQARTAADNLIDTLSGKPATRSFKPELICIIDSLDKGVLVFRDEKRGFALPGTRLFHWSKRAFERWHMRQYR